VARGFHSAIPAKGVHSKLVMAAPEQLADDPPEEAPEDLPECSICLEYILHDQDRCTVAGTCRHSFHWMCMKTCLEVDTRCPNCRAVISEVLHVHADETSETASRHAVEPVERKHSDHPSDQGGISFSTVLRAQTERAVKQGEPILFRLMNGIRVCVPAPHSVTPGTLLAAQLPDSLCSYQQLFPALWPRGCWHPCRHCNTSMYLLDGQHSFTCTQCGNESRRSTSSKMVKKTMKSIFRAAVVCGTSSPRT